MARRLGKDSWFFLALAAALGVFVAFGRAPLTSVAAAPGAAKVELVAATFSSAWCTSCKILKPKLAKVLPEFDDGPIAFVELDFTFGQKDETRKIAVTHGFEAVYDRYEGATGFTLLIDRDTGEIVDTINAGYPEAAMRASLAAALKIAEATIDQNDHQDG